MAGLEGTNIFSYTYNYYIIMADDGKGALDCFFLCFPFITMNISRGCPALPLHQGYFWRELCKASCAVRETVANLTSHQFATNTCEKEQRQFLSLWHLALHKAEKVVRAQGPKQV